MCGSTGGKEFCAAHICVLTLSVPVCSFIHSKHMDEPCVLTEVTVFPALLELLEVGETEYVNEQTKQSFQTVIHDGQN